MSKFKKILAAMVGTAMSANVFLTMPFSVFADNISQTFEFDGYTVGYEVENIHWITHFPMVNMIMIKMD